MEYTFLIVILIVISTAALLCSMKKKNSGNIEHFRVPSDYSGKVEDDINWTYKNASKTAPLYTSGPNFQPLEPPMDKNVAYVTMQFDDMGIIVAKRKRGNKWTRSYIAGSQHNWTRFNKYRIPDMKEGDILEFYLYNGGGPAGMRGQVLIDQERFVTNPTNFISEGFLRNGIDVLHRDRQRKNVNDGFINILPKGTFNDSHNRDIRFHGGNRGTYEDAAQVAFDRGHKYFGSQYKGEFYTDNRYGRYGVKDVVWQWNATNYKWYANTSKQHTGGHLGNRVFSLTNGRLKVPNFKWWENRNYNYWFLDQNSKWIAPDLGQIMVRYWKRRWIGWYISKKNVEAYPSPGKWWCMSWKYKAKAKKEFCPDNRYVEFNPAGCWLPGSAHSCRTSVRDNWRAKNRLCVTKNKDAYPRHLYQSDQFFYLIMQAIDNLKKNQSNGISWTMIFSTFYNRRFIGQLVKIISLSCRILELEGIEAPQCFKIKPTHAFLINAIKNNKIEKLRLMDLINKTKIIVDKHKGSTERTNDWNNEMDILVKAAKIVQGHALKTRQCGCKSKMLKNSVTCMPC